MIETEGKYILDGKTPKPIHDLIAWAKWFENGENRRVAEKYIGVFFCGFQIDTIRVSTIFLGMDHNFLQIGPPVLFETMIFGGPRDGWQERCCTWEEAEKMHEEAIGIAKANRVVRFGYFFKRLWNIARRRNGISQPS